MCLLHFHFLFIENGVAFLKCGKKKKKNHNFVTSHAYRCIFNLTFMLKPGLPDLIYEF